MKSIDQLLAAVGQSAELAECYGKVIHDITTLIIAPSQAAAAPYVAERLGEMLLKHGPKVIDTTVLTLELAMAYAHVYMLQAALQDFSKTN